MTAVRHAGDGMSGQPGWVLALDCCGHVTTLALGQVRDESVEIVRESELAPRTAAAQLVPAIDHLLRGVAPTALRALVVVRGPGSFTGMRIGLSCAKALAEAAGVALVGVSRLAVLQQVSGCAWAALDAGRGRAYVRGAFAPEPVGRAGDTTEERMLTEAEARALLLDAAAVALCEERLEGWFSARRRVPEPRAADALRLGAGRVQAADWDDPVLLDALYLWREEQMLVRPSA